MTTNRPGIVNVNGAVGHDGGIAGFASLSLSFPEAETTAIILISALPSRSTGDAIHSLLKLILTP